MSGYSALCNATGMRCYAAMHKDIGMAYAAVHTVDKRHDSQFYKGCAMLQACSFYLVGVIQHML